MRVVSASHLPQEIGEAGRQVVARHDNVEVVAASLDAAHVDRICTALLTASEQLRSMPVQQVIGAVDGAARRLRDPAGSARADVLASLQAISGFSEAMAAHLLDRVTADWSAPALEQLLHAELGGAAAVESFTERAAGRSRAVAPALGLHVFAGNVPGPGVTSIVRALLVRSAVLAKTAAAEPVLAAAFARLLCSVDPDVGNCVAVTYWRGGDALLEDAALARAGMVVHYGGGDAIRDLRARAPAHVRFVEHGPRVSFAIIRASGVDVRDAARDLARAVALFDQQGCVSPQAAWVVGTREQARELAAATAAALDSLRGELPRGRIDAAEAAAIHDLRAHAEFGGIAGKGSELWAPSDLAYTVILSDDSAFEGSCLNRTLLIKHVRDANSLPGILQPFGSILQTAGLEGFVGDELTDLAAALAQAGVTRMTSIADMPWPPPTWHHDGRGPLQELIRWVDLEI